MRKLFLMALLLTMAVAFNGCTKDNVTPVKPTTGFQSRKVVAASDTTGGQENPVWPN